ncbi:hypothetical protein VP1G_11059 [Cytospora mali]|uniref:Uncharacterized protein n=1 Tax=Cytospora mali TaxID=578113 RepID=A0A194V4Y8_CYTMA|nr:hypothetical protein VP1G_11059 [Valsa mali var. pyri (nom. inval.)]
MSVELVTNIAIPGAPRFRPAGEKENERFGGKKRALIVKVSSVSWEIMVEQDKVPREELELPGRDAQGAGNEVRVIFDLTRAIASRLRAGDPVVEVPEAERWN